MEAKFEEIKSCITAAHVVSGSGPSEVLAIMEEFKNVMPALSLEDFERFDAQLGEDAELREKLIRYLNFKVAGIDDLNKAIHNTMHSMMTKEVQLKFSGTGKTFKGIGKLNFSATNVYSCLEGMCTKVDTIFDNFILILCSCFSGFFGNVSKGNCRQEFGG